MTEKTALSLSELRALVIKAARGAGLSWGLAEEAGWAAEWLVRRGLPAADWAAVWLDACVNGGIGPVEVGVALADRAAVVDLTAGGAILPDELPAPGYLLPFLHRIALQHGALDLRSPHGHVARINAQGDVLFGPFWSDSVSGWRLMHEQAPDSPMRTTVTPAVVECLEGLALKTTVPPSEQSRQDAGSLAGDND